MAAAPFNGSGCTSMANPSCSGTISRPPLRVHEVEVGLHQRAVQADHLRRSGGRRGRGGGTRALGPAHCSIALRRGRPPFAAQAPRGKQHTQPGQAELRMAVHRSAGRGRRPAPAALGCCPQHSHPTPAAAAPETRTRHLRQGRGGGAGRPLSGAVALGAPQPGKQTRRRVQAWYRTPHAAAQWVAPPAAVARRPQLSPPHRHPPSALASSEG